MKKRILSLCMALALVMAMLSTAALAASFPPEESRYWHNTTESEAVDMLENITSYDYHIFVYYSGTCPNSARAVPQMADLADELGLQMYGYNCDGGSDAVGLAIAQMINRYTLTWPVVMVYNSETGHSQAILGADLDGLISALDYCGLYEAPEEDTPSGGTGNSGSSSLTLTYDDSISSDEWEVLRLTNQHRMSIGLDPLSTFDDLQMVANQRAEEITVEYNADHSRPDGSECFTAFDDYDLTYRTAAENIASGYRSAADVVDGWLNSSGHRANIENGALTHMGVGEMSRYWSQDFVGSSCSYSSISLDQTTLSGKAGQDLETILADADVTVTARCSVHGTCYLPLIADMCYGYDPNAAGAQTIAVELDGQTTQFTLNLASTCTEHVYDQGKVTKAATCAAEGVKTYTCTLCGATKTEPIPMTPHTPNANGICTVCGQKVADATSYKVNTQFLGQWKDYGSIIIDNLIPESDSRAKPGTTVGVQVMPKSGYSMNLLQVVDGSGNVVATLQGNPASSAIRYCKFDMPASDVTIQITFAPIVTEEQPTDTTPDDQSSTGSLPFRDVSGHWALEGITYAYEHGLFSGTSDTQFSPETNMNRAMVVTVLARYAGENTEGGSTWYAKGQAWAMQQGISDGTNMTGSITREQLATMLYRYAGSPSASGSLGVYPDYPSVSAYAVDAMRWAVSSGLISGMDGYLNPQGNATRAQVATIMMRFCEM